MGLFFRRDYFDYSAHDSIEAVPHSKLYATIMWVSILGIIAAFSVLVLGLTQAIKITSGVVLFVSILLIIFAGLLSVLPWIKHLEKKEYKITSFIFLGFTGLCVVLWIVCAILIYTMYRQLIAETEFTHLVGKLRTFQACLAITMQFVIASLVTTTILKYKKKWLPLQIVMFIGYLFIDFVITFSLCCLKFDANSDNLFELSDAFQAVILNRVTLVLLVLAAIYVLAANSLIYNSERKKVRRNFIMKMQKEENNETETKPVQEKPSANDRLVSLKKMLDDGLITEEEYNAKKEEILKDM